MSEKGTRRALPEDFKLKYVLDYAHDAKLQRAFTIGSLVLAILMAQLMHAAHPFQMDLTSDTAGLNTIYALVLLVGSVWLLGHVRGLLHGLALKLFSNKTGSKLKFHFRLGGTSAWMPECYYSKGAYMAVLLLPMILCIGLLCVPLFFLGDPWFWAVYLVQIINVSAYFRDILAVYFLYGLPEMYLLLDNGMLLKVYWPDGAQPKQKKELF